MKKVKVARKENGPDMVDENYFSNGKGGLNFSNIVPEACVTFKFSDGKEVKTETIYDNFANMYAASALAVQEKIGPEYENIVKNNNELPREVVENYVINRRNSVIALVEGKFKDIVRSAIYKARYAIINDIKAGGASDETIEELLRNVRYDVDIVIHIDRYSRQPSPESLSNYNMGMVAANNRINQIITTYNDICNNVIPNIIMREYDEIHRIMLNRIAIIRGAELYDAISERLTSYLCAASDEMMYNLWNLINTAIVADAAAFPMVKIGRRNNNYYDEY